LIVNAIQLFDYPRSQSLKLILSITSMGINSTFASIGYLFHISDREFIKSIPLALMGPKRYDTPFDFLFHKPDSILFYGSKLFIGYRLTN